MIRYRIANVVIDPDARAIERDGVKQDVPRRVFDCLVFLIEQRARAVGRDELIQRVWRRANVSDNQLAQTIAAARKILDDDGGQQRFIRTIPCFGYQLVGVVSDEVVETVHGGDAGGISESSMPALRNAVSTRRVVRGRWVALAMMVLALGGVSMWWSEGVDAPATPSSAAAPHVTQANWIWVLPAEVSGPEVQWARVGIAALIADRLRHQGMVVVPIDNVMARLESDQQPQEPERLRRAWGAARLVVPKVRRAGALWRVDLAVYAADGMTQVSASSGELFLAGQQSADSLSIGGSRAQGDGASSARIAMIEQLIRNRDYENAVSQMALLSEDVQRHPEARLLEVQLAMEQGRYDEASQRVAALFSEIRPEDAPATVGRLGIMEINLIRFRQSTGWEGRVDAVVALLMKHGKPRDLASALGLRGNRAIMRDDFDAAEADFTRAQQLFLIAGDELGAARESDSLARVALARGRSAEAVRLFDECARVYERYAAVGRLTRVLHAMVLAHINTMHWEDAASASDRAGALVEKMNDGERANFLEDRALVMQGLGRLREASALFGESDRSSAKSDRSRDDQVFADLLRLDLKLQQGRYSEVLRAAPGLYAVLASNGMPDFQWYREQRDSALVLWLDARRQWRRSVPAVSLPEIAPEPAALSQPSTVFAWLARGHRHLESDALPDAEAAYRRALRMAIEDNQLNRILWVSDALTVLLVDSGRVDEAALVVDALFARDPFLAERDFQAALMLLRIRQAQADLPAWRHAAAVVRRLAGERHIPPELLRPPAVPSATDR